MGKQALHTETTFNKGLLDFLGRSPTPFHATANIADVLESAGYTRLYEGDSWALKGGKKYFVTRNDSSIIAFQLGNHLVAESGLRIVGAHTDSPCLKVKPNSNKVFANFLQAGVEIYGGVLLSTWFDRDLSLAGRITYRTKNGELKNTLINLGHPVAIVPSLAIHLNRGVNENASINKQLEMPPILMQFDGETPPSLHDLLCEDIEDAQKILDWDLSFYDTQIPAMVGWRGDFIASARLDNLLSCYTGLQSLLQAGPEITSVLVCNDHEEVGSASHHGAAGPFLRQVVQRICPSAEEYHRAISQSTLISCDNAHGIHPNYPDKHDELHGPILNKGPVIKINSNQRYASNSETAGMFADLADRAKVPVQKFVARADMGCGSTIGPITASNLGLRTVDVGVPTFAMHSTRELAGSKDAFSLHQILNEFYRLR